MAEFTKEELRIAREMVSDPDVRAQVKVKLAMDGHQLVADLIDEAVLLARAILRTTSTSAKKS